MVARKGGQGDDDYDNSRDSTTKTFSTVDSHITEISSVDIKAGSGDDKNIAGFRAEQTKISGGNCGTISTSINTSRIGKNSDRNFNASASAEIPKKKRKKDALDEDDMCGSSVEKQRHDQDRLSSSINPEMMNSSSTANATDTQKAKAKAETATSINKKKVLIKDGKKTQLGGSINTNVGVSTPQVDQDRDKCKKSGINAPQNIASKKPTSVTTTKSTKSSLKSATSSSSSLPSSCSASAPKNNHRQSKNNHYMSRYDVWNRIPPKDVTAICSNCGKFVGVARFAVHLDKCMGIGNVRKSSM